VSPSLFKVLLVDDHKIVREGLKSLLSSAPELKIIGEAEDGERAVAMVKAKRPHLVIMDIAMPRMNGKEAALKLRHCCPHVKILILSSYYDEHLVREMVFAGAAGFIAKQTASEDLLEGVRRVLSGDNYFSQCILQRFQSAAVLSDLTAKTREAAIALTAREIQVLELIAQGFTNPQVAAALSSSITAVENHRNQVLSKLSIHEPAELEKYAMAADLVERKNIRHIVD
jgi:two-component system, NarL family, nitrate/nitrite response regulator NarL